MSEPTPRSLIDNLLRGAVAIMIAAITVSFAVCLIRQIWPWIVGVAFVIAAVYIAARWVQRRRGWW